MNVKLKRFVREAGGADAGTYGSVLYGDSLLPTIQSYSQQPEWYYAGSHVTGSTISTGWEWKYSFGYYDEEPPYAFHAECRTYGDSGLYPGYDTVFIAVGTPLLGGYFETVITPAQFGLRCIVPYEGFPVKYLALTNMPAGILYLQREYVSEGGMMPIYVGGEVGCTFQVQRGVAAGWVCVGEAFLDEEFIHDFMIEREAVRIEGGQYHGLWDVRIYMAYPPTVNDSIYMDVANYQVIGGEDLYGQRFGTEALGECIIRYYADDAQRTALLEYYGIEYFPPV